MILPPTAVSETDLVIVHQVNVCQNCHYSLVSLKPLRFNKRQIFEIQNGSFFVTEHQAEVKLCPFYRIRSYVCSLSKQGGGLLISIEAAIKGQPVALTT